MKLPQIILALIVGLTIFSPNIHASRLRKAALSISTVSIALILGTYVYTESYPDSQTTTAIHKEADHAKQHIKAAAQNKKVRNMLLRASDTLEDIGPALRIRFKEFLGESCTLEKTQNNLRKKTRAALRKAEEQTNTLANTIYPFKLRLMLGVNT